MKISSQLVLKLIILFALFVAIAESKKRKKFKLFGKKKKKGKKAVTTTTSARRAAIASAKAQRKPPVTRSQVTARPTNKQAAKKAAKAKRSANKTASPRRNAAVAAKMQPTGPYHKKTNLKLVYKTLLPPGLRRPENNIVFEFTDNEDGKTCRCICRTK